MVGVDPNLEFAADEKELAAPVALFHAIDILPLQRLIPGCDPVAQLSGVLPGARIVLNDLPWLVIFVKSDRVAGIYHQIIPSLRVY